MRKMPIKGRSGALRQARFLAKQTLKIRAHVYHSLPMSLSWLLTRLHSHRLRALVIGRCGIT